MYACMDVDRQKDRQTERWIERDVCVCVSLRLLVCLGLLLAKKPLSALLHLLFCHFNELALDVSPALNSTKAPSTD